MLRRDIAKDEVLTYDDVELPAGRLADRLRAEQYRHFRGETWLEVLDGVGAPPGGGTALAPPAREEAGGSGGSA